MHVKLLILLVVITLVVLYYVLVIYSCDIRVYYHIQTNNCFALDGLYLYYFENTCEATTIEHGLYHIATVLEEKKGEI